MKVRVPLMVQDPMTAKYKGSRIIEGFDIEAEQFFLDGPVTERVAVLDFDPETGQLHQGAPFRPPAAGRKLARYVLADEDAIYAPDFIQVSVFATVLKTIYLFEDKDGLGRRLNWAFDAPQLLVVPRAGELANAFYERESHSLQFFFFPSAQNPDETVYASLSRDIVAHETGHAALDSIAPDLYHAISPQSLALHEAIADLTAMFMAFSSHTLREAVLEHTGGQIRDPSAFSALAEQFGTALDPNSSAGSLRSLVNEKTLDPADHKNFAGDEPHELSEVLSGALYDVMIKIHDQQRAEIAQQENRSEFSASGKALAKGAARFKRMVFRALDYLPPGEISFADFGRAIIAVDQASYPDHEQEREWIRESFLGRHIITDRAELEVKPPFEYPPLKDINLETLVNSDWAAYEFANTHRELLGIPKRIPIWVRPRLHVAKTYYYHDKPSDVHECLFKVSWDHKEPNQPGSSFPAERQITLGSTLVIDWETRQVRARLTTTADEQQAARSRLIRRLVDEDVLQIGREALGPDGNLLRSVIRAEALDGLMRIRGAARMLHIAK